MRSYSVAMAWGGGAAGGAATAARWAQPANGSSRSSSRGSRASGRVLRIPPSIAGGIPIGMDAMALAREALAHRIAGGDARLEAAFGRVPRERFLPPGIPAVRVY